MTGQAFLQHLLRKLKTGNARSVHLNALPGHYARLDLYDLINIHSSLHLKFIRALLSQPTFRLEIHIDFKRFGDDEEAIRTARQIARKLDAMSYQQRDEFMEYGIKTFGFGYPLLIKVEEDRILKAPLLIWQLELEKDLHRQFTWTISRKSDHSMVFNELLRSHITRSDGIQTDDLLPLLEEDHLSEPELSGFVARILHKLGVESKASDPEVKVLPATNKETIEKHSQAEPWIRWSGLFSSYKSQKQSIIRDIETLTLDTASSVEHVEHPVSPILAGEELMSVVPTDPSQDSILYHIRETDQQVIQGPPGTGKSQVLTAVITDRLYHGKKCLIVCEKKTALDVIYRNLADAGLDELCVVIDDIHGDRKQVVQRVRQLLEDRKSEAQPFRNIEFEELLEDRTTLKQQLDNYLQTTNERCFGDDTLHDLVGRWHRDRATVSHELINLQAIAPYSYDRFRPWKDLVDSGCKLYEGIEDTRILNRIDDAVFMTDRSLHEFMQHIKGLQADIAKWQKEHENAVRHFGSDYTRVEPAPKIRYLSWLWPPFKRVLEARERSASLYATIREQWLKTLWDQPADDLHHHASAVEGMAKQLDSIGSLLQQMLDHMTQSDAYLPWRRFLIEIGNPNRQVLTALAAQIPPEAWLKVFTLSYWNSFIRQQVKDIRSSTDLEKQLINYAWLDEEVRQRLPASIRHHWEKRQKSLLNDRTIQKTKHLYNFRRNKKYGRRNSLRKIIHRDLELFTTTFPVLMVNPTVCASILPLVEGDFDCVLLDEASQLRIEDTYTALLRGRKRIISGDRHQMPPSDHFASDIVLEEGIQDDDEVNQAATDEFLAASPSLLEYGMDTDYASAFLDFHYRSRHPDLIAFSNAAFYGDRLVPMPPSQQTQALEFHAIDGTYTKQRTNPDEARAIAAYVLQGIEPIDGSFPSVGIATFNINQRNLIWDELMALSHKSDADAERLGLLIQQGLFVKNLEHVQGDERDIILISTTFGKDESGQFRQSFGPLSQEKGYKLLNVIITRARQKMAVFSSIPMEAITGYRQGLEHQGNTGKAILYAFLQYVNFIDAGQQSAANELLQLVSMHCHETKYQHETGQMPLFHQQLYSALQAEYGPDMIRHNQSFGGFVLHIAVVQEERVKMAIQTTLLPKKVDRTSCKKLLYRQKILAEHQVRLVTVDVMDWHECSEDVLAELKQQVDSLQ